MNVIDDEQLNFLFSRGNNLKEGLIDISKAYCVVKRLEPKMGQSNINYDQIASQLLDIHLNHDKIDDGTTQD